MAGLNLEFRHAKTVVAGRLKLLIPEFEELNWQVVRQLFCRVLHNQNMHFVI
jgi:hypothetical protein